MKKSLGAKTLVHPAPVFVIGTYDANDKPNAMAASWAGLCCSVPPCVAVSLRKATYTYENILHHRAFTVSIPSQDNVQEVDYLGMASGRNEDKFRKARLTPVASKLVHAPYVEEFPLVLECKLLHTLEIGLHTLFVGEILDVKAEEAVLRPDDLTDIAQLKPLIFSPDTLEYYGVGEKVASAFSVGKMI